MIGTCTASQLVMHPLERSLCKSPFLAFLLVLPLVSSSAWINYPPTGYATMTHYEMPRDYVASCGCMPASTHYPTAALSQMAYGSSTSYGPGCGRCFNLTLLNTFLSTPPFYPPKEVSIVAKITDLCPLSADGWCSGMENKMNPAGHQLNFDLAFPSLAIPSNFFPSDASQYGYTDFGVWNISYEAVSCDNNWSGSKQASALGSVPSLGTGACCPADPPWVGNDTCPSFSDQAGLPPDTRSSGHAGLYSALHIPAFVVLMVIELLSYSFG